MIKEFPISFSNILINSLLEGKKTQTRRILSCDFAVDKKYGEAGDLLWVRESWCAHWSVYPEDVKTGIRIEDAEVQQDNGSISKSSKENPIFVYYEADGEALPYPHLKWLPNKDMPRWASRILLEVTGKRIEALQDITEEDAKKEGCSNDCDPFWIPSYYDPDGGGHPSFRENFKYLWQEIYGLESWENNPLVLVLEFKRVL